MTGFLSELLRSLTPLADLVLGRDSWLLVPDEHRYVVCVKYNPVTRRVERIVSIVTGDELDAIDLGNGCSFTVGQPLPTSLGPQRDVTGGY